ncbi:hypothetical protein PAMP_016650 [Pampus punctatissimus]
MSRGSTSSVNLDPRVIAYLEDREREVLKSLEIQKTKLLTYPQDRRHEIKSRIENLHVILQHLQVRKSTELDGPNKDKMRQEILDLKTQLHASKSQQKEYDWKMQACSKIIRELKNQLQQARVNQFSSAEEAQIRKEEHCKQLQEVQCTSAAMLSVQVAINEDLTSKLEEAKKQLQQSSQHSATEAPKDVPELPKSTEKIEKHACDIQPSQQQDEETEPVIEEKLKVQEAQELVPAAETNGSVQSPSTDTPVSELQQTAPEEEEKEPHPDLCEENKTVCFTISQLQTFFNNSANEAWKEKEATLNKQKAEISQLRDTIKKMEEHLKIQQQHFNKVLQKKNQELAHKVRLTEQQNTPNEETPRTPKRRNWFLRMFACVSTQVEP